MNNSGAIYLATTDVDAAVAALNAGLEQLGFAPADHDPGDSGNRIMIPEKRRRLFYIAPPHNGWIAVWEDPRYFADRRLALSLSALLQTRSVWIEVGGNGVSWARGLYDGGTVGHEQYEEVETTFYGEYGIVNLAFDPDLTPDEWISELGLPDDELHYEAVLDGAVPAGGTPLHLAFTRTRR
jgi:hypothetical protein